MERGGGHGSTIEVEPMYMYVMRGGERERGLESWRAGESGLVEKSAGFVISLINGARRKRGHAFMDLSVF